MIILMFNLLKFKNNFKNIAQAQFYRKDNCWPVSL